MLNRNFAACAYLAIACLLTPTASVPQSSLPNVTPVKPLPGDPLVDHQISDCSGIFGFGAYLYDTLDHIIQLSDFCLLENKGVAVAAETISGLQLTSDGADSQLYEVLSTGDDRYSRNSVTFYSHEDESECETPGAQRTFEYSIPNENALKHFRETGFGWHRGYVIDQSVAKPNVRQGKGLVWLQAFSQAELPSRTRKPYELGEDGGFWATIVSSTNGGEIKIYEGYGHHYGTAQGVLSFQYDGKGGFTATGRLERFAFNRFHILRL